MTSKRLFADICNENMKRRLWPLALSVTGNFFAQIVFAFLVISVYEDRLESKLAILEDVQIQYYQVAAGATSIPVMIILFGLALVNALQGFNYLFDGKMSDLYGAIPVRREKLFDGVCFNGILIFIIPYLICNMFTVILGVTKGYVTVNQIPFYMIGAITVIIMYCMVYMTCVLAAIMTGHVVVAVLASGVFMFAGPLFYECIKLYETEFFMSYSENPNVLRGFLSPFSICVEIVSCILAKERIWYPKTTYPYVIASIVLSAILFIISRLLIVRRPSESAGKAIAFNVTKPVIKIVLSVSTTLFAGLLFYSMSGSKMGGMVFGIFSGIILTHAVIETIFAFDFKESFKHFGSLLISLLITVFIVVAFIFDLFHYDVYLPRPDRVESAAVSTSAIYGNVISQDMYDENMVGTISEHQLEIMKLTDIESVDALATKGAEYAEQKRLERIFCASEDDYFQDGETDGKYVSLTFKWNLKNGRSVSRSYYVDFADDTVREYYGKLFDSDEYKKGTFGILTATPDQFDELYWTDLSGEHYLTLTNDQKVNLIAALSKDIMNQSFNDLCTEDACNEFSLFSNNKKYYYDKTAYNFFLFPSYTNTIAYLEKEGIPTDWKIIDDNAGMMGLSFYDDEDSGYWETSDIDEIRSVADHMQKWELQVVNSILKTDDEQENDKGISAFVSVKENSDFINVILYQSEDFPEELSDEIENTFHFKAEDSALSGKNGWNACVSSGL